MKASDMMKSKVVTIEPEASVKSIAAALCGHDISAVPVCDAGGDLLGIVSEGELFISGEN